MTASTTSKAQRLRCLLQLQKMVLTSDRTSLGVCYIFPMSRRGWVLTLAIGLMDNFEW